MAHLQEILYSHDSDTEVYYCLTGYTTQRRHGRSACRTGTMLHQCCTESLTVHTEDRSNTVRTRKRTRNPTLVLLHEY